MAGGGRRKIILAPASPLENDDLLSEILLRLPPSPSSLPHASLVCKRWRRLVADPGFRRRFGAHHLRKPPLLGFFFKGESCISFAPTMEPPDRIPPERFSLPLDNIDGWEILCCRHGLVLLLHRNPLQILVWDPLTGDLIRIAVPVGLDNLVAMADSFDGAVLRSDAGKDFQVVLVREDDVCTRVLLFTHR
ncbi:hypothetical protein PR202_gb23761 [Eleusine coracana subsp. coracana]|uniref:F-box domain-containing protein n=1 Tax=Eleusine coracana subsp. coracana TaxID=191504 RepID=A0AAV5FH24_ELECO|nr:hypothetical protein PR202_gb23761 [Eleusine coracana subsp. coracana]